MLQRTIIIILIVSLFPLTSLAAITFTNKTTSFDNTDATSYTTASVSPTSNLLYLLAVTTRNATVDPSIPTVTGNGLTWVNVTSTNYDATGSQRRITLFRAMGASPSAGTITIDLGGQTQTGAIWSLAEVTGIDTTGTNGSGAVTQSKWNVDKTALVNTLAVTLSTVPLATSSVFATFAMGDGSQTFSPNPSFTELSEQANPAENNIALETQYALTGIQTASTTATGNSEMGGIAVEIKAADAVPSVGGGGTRRLLGKGISR